LFVPVQSKALYQFVTGMVGTLSINHFSWRTEQMSVQK
jgi:hypothetical protein